MGSTMPEACPYIKLLKRKDPLPERMETAAPSGKFYSMPMATAIGGVASV